MPEMILIILISIININIINILLTVTLISLTLTFILLMYHHLFHLCFLIFLFYISYLRSQEMGCVGTMDDVEFKDTQIKSDTPIDDQIQSTTKTIKVCTVNLQKYSPFEYVLNDKQPHIRQYVPSTSFNQDKLGQCFNLTYQRYPSRLITKQKKYRQMLQILHKETVKRYCPLTNQEVGILSDQQKQIIHQFIQIDQQKQKQKSESKLRNRKIRLMNTKEFCEKWDDQFKHIKNEQRYKNIRKKIFAQFSSSQIIKQMIKDLKQFDLICYHSLLVFNQKIKQTTRPEKQLQSQCSSLPQAFPLPLVNILLKAPLIDKQLTNMECCEDIQRIIKNGEFMKYIWMMKQLFSKVCLNQDHRIQKLVSWLEKNAVDVVFLQDVNNKDVELMKVLLKGHRIVHSDNNCSAILVKESLVKIFELNYANLTLTGHNARYLSSSNMQTNNKSWISKQFKKTRNSVLKKTSNKNENENLIRDLKYILQHDSEDGEQKQRNKIMQINYRQQQHSLSNYQWNDMHANQGIGFEEEEEVGVEEQLETDLQKKYKDILENLTTQIVDKVHTILLKHNEALTPKQQPTNSPKPKHQKRKKQQHHPQQQQKSKSSLLQQYINSPNIILMNKQTFLQKQHIFNQTIFNNNLIQFIGSLILISAHVKSGSVAQMREKLIELRRTFPYHTIIVGVCTEPKSSKSKDRIVDTMKGFRKVRSKQLEDSEEQIMNTFHFAPDIYDSVPGIFFQDKHAIDTKKLKTLTQKNGYYTSLTKKTQLQIIQEQRNRQYMGADNFILTNKQISSYSIVSCEEQINNNKDYCKQEHIIPNQKHPFGNYFVVACVQVDVKQVVIDTEVCEE